MTGGERDITEYCCRRGWNGFFEIGRRKKGIRG